VETVRINYLPLLAAIHQVEAPIKSHGPVQKMKLPWKKRKLCFFFDDKGEVIQEWIGTDLGASYVICETMGVQVCYQIPKPLIGLFKKEKKLDNTKLSCA
jgi:hypothetical protein